VGLYVGKGLFIHSGSSGVQVSDLRDPYWREHIVAATRIVG
jgi:cell wall-associated NlpC family hydrolase